jgi:hypothetical protein
MSPHSLHWIVPLPDSHIDVADILQLHQTAYAFYQEVQYREALANDVAEYHQLAEQHQAELNAMRQDINIMGWFNRRFHRRRSPS